MKQKNVSLLAGVILINSLLISGCLQSKSEVKEEKQETSSIYGDSVTDYAEKAIKESDFDKAGYYTISSGGVYKFAGDIGSASKRYAIIVNIQSNETVVLDGANKKLYGKCTYNDKGDNNVILCSGSGQVNIKNLTIDGDGSNAIRIGDGLKASSSVVNVKIENPAHAICRPGKSGGGGIEIGKGSMSDCKIVSGDDAIKASEAGASAKGINVTMQGNGSSIQFGYDTRCNGAGHKISDVDLYGNTSLDEGDLDETCDAPNYAAIGGNFATKGISGVVTENIKIHSSKNFRYIVKFVVFANGEVSGLDIKANCMTGITKHNSKGKVFHPIVIVVKGGTIKGKITLSGAGVPSGDKIGDLVKFQKSAGSNVDLTINGKKYN